MSMSSGLIERKLITSAWIPCSFARISADASANETGLECATIVTSLPNKNKKYIV